MKTQRRWLNNVIKEAARTKVDLPWSREAKRAALNTKYTRIANCGIRNA